MTKDKDTKTVVPALRFPEFRDGEGWRQKILSEILDYERPDNYIVSNANYCQQGTPVLTANKSFILGYTEEDYGICNNLPVVLFDDFTIDKKYVDFPFKVKSSAIKLLRTKNDDDLKFVFEMMSLIMFEAKEHKRYYISSYQNQNVYMPKPTEQIKIANCLGSLDGLISAVTDKIEALKEYKKGLMQQLFPAESKTTPAFRFPEFQNAGEWMLLPIKKCNIDILTGYAFKGTEILEDNDGIPLMRGINITEGVVRHNNDIDRFYSGEDHTLSKYRLLCNDLVIAMDGSKVGRNFALINKQDEGSLLVQRVARLRADNIDFIMFIYQQIGSDRFKKYIDRINTSSGIPHISLKQIEDFKIWTTRNDKEFRMVTNCLSSVDELISTEIAKLDQLKAHKKGLMQQLFPKLQ